MSVPLDANGLLPHDSEAAQPRPPREQRPVWKDRIGTYLFGVGIGVVLVFMFLAARAQHKANVASPSPPPAPSAAVP